MRFRRSLGMGVCALALPLASACGSSSTVKPPAPTTADAGRVDFGGRCSESQNCQSLVCLRFTPNQEDASGICSTLCPTGVECGPRGACLPLSVIDSGACFPTCTGTGGCLGGLPCIWNSAMGTGICQPLPVEFCSEIAAQGPCEACLGSSCCPALTACAEDFDCSQMQASCSGQPACANTLESSANPTAQNLGTSAASACASACQ